MVAKLAQRFVDEDEDGGKRVEVVWLGLPPLQVLNNFRCFLAFAEVDEVAREILFASVLDMGERGQEYT